MKKALKAAGGKVRVLVADPQYSSRRVRIRTSNHGIKPVTPYPSNQKPMEEQFLRVDKLFRVHGPESMKRLYTFKASIERVISRLKEHLNLENHKVKVLRNILTNALLGMLLVALTAIKLGKPEQIRAITKLT